MIRTGKRFRPTRAATRYDVIVIGSGIGGLCNAALLSKLGYKVCVLEQHYTAGGYTHAYEREGYEWDVGVHYIGEVHKPWSMIRRIFDVITDSKLQWAPMDATYDRVVMGDAIYDFTAGRDVFTQDLISRFPEEKAAIVRYVQLLSEVSSRVPRFFAGQAMPPLVAKWYNRARRWVLPDYFFKTTRDVLLGLTQNETLIGVLTAQWGDYGLPPAQSSFLMHAMVAKHYITGGNYPVGGASEIARSIIPVIQQAGGEVFTYAGVDQVLVKDQVAYGVRLKSGDEIYADKVVSNAGLLPTLNQLLPEAVVRKAGYHKQKDKVQLSASHLCLYAGFKGSAASLGLPRTNYWVYPSADHDGNVLRFSQDPTQPMPLIYISFPSAKDPAWDARYPDKATVEIVAPTHHAWFSQWAGTQWQKRGAEYAARKQALTEALLEVLYRFMPQLRDALDFCELSTPVSTQWFQWNEAGEIYGIDHTVERFDQAWIHPVTPIKNFYLTGADVVTAGVGGALIGGVMTTAAMTGLKAWQLVQLIRSSSAAGSQAGNLVESVQ